MRQAAPWVRRLAVRRVADFPAKCPCVHLADTQSTASPNRNLTTDGPLRRTSRSNNIGVHLALARALWSNSR